MKEEIKEILSLCEDSIEAMDDLIVLINSDKVKILADSKNMEYLDMRLSLAYKANLSMVNMLKDLAEQ